MGRDAPVKRCASGVPARGHGQGPTPASAGSPHPPKASCWKAERGSHCAVGRAGAVGPAASFLLVTVPRRRLAQSPRAARPAPREAAHCPARSHRRTERVRALGSGARTLRFRERLPGPWGSPCPFRGPRAELVLPRGSVLGSGFSQASRWAASGSPVDGGLGGPFSLEPLVTAWRWVELHSFPRNVARFKTLRFTSWNSSAGLRGNKSL